MYRLIFASRAAKFFESANAPLQRRLDRCFDQLRRDPRRHNNIKPLKGPLAGYLRYRVGDWRVIYRIDDAANTIYIADIANRRDVYE